MKTIQQNEDNDLKYRDGIEDLKKKKKKHTESTEGEENKLELFLE